MQQESEGGGARKDTTRRRVGTIHRHADGSLSGILRTLLVRTQLDIRPVRDGVGASAYEVYSNADFCFGTACAGPADQPSSLTFTLAAPELPTPLKLVAVPEGEGTLSLFWDMPSPP